MKYQLGDIRTINCSDERGEVIGRAEYAAKSEPVYLVRYVDGTGCAVEKWWDESAIS